jgi:Zn-dependent peptidase ImmA (M78 family)
MVESEGELLDAFLYEHDLCQMKHGSGLSSCFVLRQHANVRIETNGRVYEDILFKTFVEQLNELGAFAVNLLRKRHDSIAIQVIERWEKRDQTDPMTVAAFLSGLPRTEIQNSSDLVNTLVRAVTNRPLSAIANDNRNPIFAAARCSGALGPASLTEVLRQIQSVPTGDTKHISALRRRIQPNLRGVQRPLDQGIRAARSVREWLGLSDDARLDLEFLSEKLGIQVKRQSIPDGRLDGIATNGPAHGPAIILNLNTRRQGARAEDLERSLRFTWSHEIGHILLDRDEWPALIDAIKQRVPRAIETRANAFAARLLLPQGGAYRRWEQNGSPVDWEGLDSFIRTLAEEFGAPRIVVSRQLTFEAPPERRKLLEQIFRARIPNFEGAGR